MRGDHFERHSSIEPGVDGLVDFAHASGSEWSDNLVRAQPPSGRDDARLRSPLAASRSAAVLAELSGALGVATNNVAEYNGLIAALQWAADNGVTALKVKGDSLLLVEQMRGNYKVKNAGLLPLYHRAKMLVMQIGNVSFAHVPREKNTDADRLSNVGMDANGG